ncbi:MAG: polysaccharide biosynthesis C-terminal domain-containing protein, partial [Candidatus Pacearchaeota archaeon]|nr:polysaccharide biosynthesis C-terminal domain-containing protein [Candidatus Pacearchaeota archaeon]
YERGRFTSLSTFETAGVFSIYLIGAFFFSASMIIARSFYALQKMVFPMAVSTLVALLTIPLYLYFSTTLGARGIAVAAVCGMACQFFTLLFFWTKRYGKTEDELSRMKTIAAIAAITLFSSGIGYLLRTWLFLHVQIEPQLLKHIIITTIVTVPMLAVTFAMYDRTGIQPFRDSLNGLLRKKQSG